MKRWLLLAPALLLVVSASAFAQDDDRFRPGQPGDDDDAFSPQEAMEMLKEAQDLMTTAEELLNDSSRGKALETEKDLLAKLDKILDSEKSDLIMKKVEKMMDKTLEKQKGAIDKLAEIIKRARA